MNRVRRYQRGVTLVEVMVASAIGLFILGGALYIYTQSRSSYRSGDALARLQESARFALDTMEPDIRLAGFWGRHAEPALLAVPGSLRVTCGNGGGDVTDWALGELTRAVAGNDDTYDLPCPAFAGAPRANSDVLVVRHASGGTATPEVGQIQVLATLAGGRLTDDGSAPASNEVLHDVVVNAYYVSDQSSFDPGQPALRQLTLVRNGVMRDEEVIPGVENLQVQYGIDADGDGNVERYVDGDDPVMAGEPRIAAVRLWLLVATPAEDASFRDPDVYQPLDGDLAEIRPGTDDDYPARARRLTVTKTIHLRNQPL